MNIKYVNTRFGTFALMSENGALTVLKSVSEAGVDNSCPILEKAEKALRSFENGMRFEDEIPVNPKCTPFQRKVYEEISKILPGETASYSEIAQRIGNKNASRAVGQALNKNPIWIFIPCHRVIGKNKALTGFAGGLELKKMLLEHERNVYFAKSSAICTAFVAAPFRT